MRSNLALGLVFALMLGLALPMAYAKEGAEEFAAEETPAMETMPAEAPAEEAPAVEVAVTEVPAEEAPAEGVLEGSLTAVDLKSEAPSVTVKVTNGTETKVDLDLDLSLVLKGDEEMALEDLAVGQSVKITQADFDGKLVVDTVEIV